MNRKLTPRYTCVQAMGLPGGPGAPGCSQLQRLRQESWHWNSIQSSFTHKVTLTHYKYEYILCTRSWASIFKKNCRDGTPIYFDNPLKICHRSWEKKNLFWLSGSQYSIFNTKRNIFQTSNLYKEKSFSPWLWVHMLLNHEKRCSKLRRKTFLHWRNTFCDSALSLTIPATQMGQCAFDRTFITVIATLYILLN